MSLSPSSLSLSFCFTVTWLNLLPRRDKRGKEGGKDRKKEGSKEEGSLCATHSHCAVASPLFLYLCLAALLTLCASLLSLHSRLREKRRRNATRICRVSFPHPPFKYPLSPEVLYSTNASQATCTCTGRGRGYFGHPQHPHVVRNTRIRKHHGKTEAGCGDPIFDENISMILHP